MKRTLATPPGTRFKKMTLSKYLKKVSSDTRVSIALNNSLWSENFELVYHASYIGPVENVPEQFMNYEVVKTFRSFMWNNLTIIVRGDDNDNM